MTGVHPDPEVLFGDGKRQTAEFKPELRVYEYCPAAGQLFKNFVVDLSGQDLAWHDSRASTASFSHVGL